MAPLADCFVAKRAAFETAKGAVEKSTLTVPKPGSTTPVWESRAPSQRPSDVALALAVCTKTVFWSGVTSGLFESCPWPGITLLMFQSCVGFDGSVTL
jgi:hypothetical protein